VSEKMTCPACDSHTSSVLAAYREGGPCPVCGLSAAAGAEILRIQDVRADEALKAELAEALKRADRAESERDKLARKLDRVSKAVNDALAYEEGQGW
jgi:hypothetical protein